MKGIVMEKKGFLTKFLAITGTVLEWLPILVMIATSTMGTLRSGMFRMDYLIPAELFPAVLIGAGMLLWAALRLRFDVKPVLWGLIGVVAGLVISQGIAVVTGLASGRVEAAGWRWVLVMGLLLVYVLAECFLGILGIRLSKRVCSKG
jgi:hypothetical protein